MTSHLRRARAPEDKAARRAEILQTAGRLFDDHTRPGGVAELTMASLAREAGLAKGTLYLYFSTKEEIFLALVLDELAQWLAALDAGLEQLESPAAEPVAALIAASVSHRERMLRLLGVLHPILERNLSEDVLRDFKLAVVALLLQPAARFEARLPQLSEGDGQRFVRRLHAIIVGLALSSRPTPAVARVMRCPELATFRTDFETELEATVAALLRGWR